MDGWMDGEKKEGRRDGRREEGRKLVVMCVSLGSRVPSVAEHEQGHSPEPPPA